MRPKMMFLLLGLLLICSDPADSQPQGRFGIVKDDNNVMRGFLSIALVSGQDFMPGVLYNRGLANLSEAMNSYTRIYTSVDQMVPLATGRIIDYPVVFLIAEKPYETTEREREVLREYFAKGGFLVIDNPEPWNDTSPVIASAYKLIKETMPSGIRIAPVPHNHNLNHSFFEFPETPVGMEIKNKNSWTVRIPEWQRTPDMEVFRMTPTVIEGVFHNDRLIALIMNKGYIHNWIYEVDSVQLRYGVNIIMFALGQEGGMAGF